MKNLKDYIKESTSNHYLTDEMIKDGTQDLTQAVSKVLTEGDSELDYQYDIIKVIDGLENINKIKKGKAFEIANDFLGSVVKFCEGPGVVLSETQEGVELIISLLKQETAV